MTSLTDNVSLDSGVVYKLNLKEFLHLPHTKKTQEEKTEHEKKKHNSTLNTHTNVLDYNIWKHSRGSIFSIQGKFSTPKFYGMQFFVMGLPAANYAPEGYGTAACFKARILLVGLGLILGVLRTMAHVHM